MLKCQHISHRGHLKLSPKVHKYPRTPYFTILKFSCGSHIFALKKKGGGGEAVSKKFMVWKFTQAIRLNFSEACLWGCISQANWVRSQHWLLVELADK